MIKSDVVRIPPRRLEQLRGIGKVLKLSVADTIAYMIRKEIQVGTIPAQIPGIVIDKVEGGVRVQIDEGPATMLRSESARYLVQVIRDAVAGKAGIVETNHNFGFTRRGAGYTISVPWGGEQHSMSRDLALEVADQIEQAA